MPTLTSYTSAPRHGDSYAAGGPPKKITLIKLRRISNTSFSENVSLHLPMAQSTIARHSCKWSRTKWKSLWTEPVLYLCLPLGTMYMIWKQAERPPRNQAARSYEELYGQPHGQPSCLEPPLHRATFLVDLNPVSTNDEIAALAGQQAGLQRRGCVTLSRDGSVSDTSRRRCRIPW